MTNTDRILIRQIQDTFLRKINEKNSWGKNEIMDLWKDCLLDILIDLQRETNDTSR